MAKPLISMYLKLLHTEYLLTYSEKMVDGALWFLFIWCEVVTRDKTQCLHKHSTTKPYMQPSDGILGQVTKCATSSKLTLCAPWSGEGGVGETNKQTIYLRHYS